MRLFNFEGSAIFGPGSEWFWSMASFVAVVVSLAGIYYQLRLARNANAFEQINRINNQWTSERATRYKLDILLALRDGADPADVPEGAASYVADFWENVAALVRAGHVDRRVVHEVLSASCQLAWARLAPNTRRYRIQTGERNSLEHFEWLTGVMAEMDRKAGVGVQYDEAYVASTLDMSIQTLQNRIRVEEDLRAVIVRPKTRTSAAR